jgi:GAF domain-containing protein
MNNNFTKQVLSVKGQGSSNLQTRSYALAGIIFGIAFLFGAMIIRLFQLQMPLTLSNIVQLQLTESLLWIIDTAPLFLGLFAGFVGRRQDALIQTNKILLKREEELTLVKENLERHVMERTSELEKRTKQWHESRYIAQQIVEFKDMPALLSRIVQLISDWFGFYHVGLFLLDDKTKLAFLQASSSDTGKELIRQGYRVEKDQRNAISLVAEQNQPDFASNTAKYPLLVDDNFPLTRSRAILPLSVRRSVIGVLDLHSDKTQLFDSEDADVFQSLAGLVAISIENVRLLSETQTLVKQQQEFTSSQSLEAWQKLTRQSIPAYQYTPEGVRPITGIADDQPALGGLRVPLTLHENIIGTITLQRSKDSPSWSERDRILVEKIAAQVALALDNSRLIKDVQKNAIRDQLLATVSSRIRETLDAESILQTAVHEFIRALDLHEIEIRLGNPLLERQEEFIGFRGFANGKIRRVEESWESDLVNSIKTNDHVTGNNGLTLSLPLKIRGQIIGAMQLIKPEYTNQWAPEETALAVAFAEQLSGALDSAEHYKDAQQRAARESLVSAISARISAAPHVETILQETAQELGRAIGNASVTFQLVAMETSDDPAKRSEPGSIAQPAIEEIGLREIQRIAREGKKTCYSYLPEGKLVEARPINDSATREVLASGENVIQSGLPAATSSIIAIPVKLREQVIGIIHIQATVSDRKWSENEINLFQTISERAATAIENASLLSESQRRATKEQAISEITAKIGASINMQNILQTAVEELGRALPGSEVVIQFERDSHAADNK